MKENIILKYYYYAIALFRYFILASTRSKKRTRIVKSLIETKTVEEMYRRYGLINLLRVLYRAPKNLNFSTSAITLFKNVYIPEINKTALSVSLEVTNNCPHRCSGCYIDVNKKKSEYFMPEHLLRKTIASLQHNEFILIQGGEPCSKKYMDTLYNVIKDFKRQAFAICTSGAYIGEFGIGKFSKLNNVVWAISINGTRDVNDKVRFKGSYDYAVKAINHIRNAQQYFVVSTTVSQVNIESATSEDFVMEMVRLGVKEIKYWVLRGPNKKISLSNADIEYWSAYTRRYNKYIFTTFSLGQPEGYCVVDPYGNMRLDRTGYDKG